MGDTSRRGREREELTRQLETESGRALLRKLRQRVPESAACASWSEVVEVMRHGTSRDPIKDAVLRAVVLAREEDAHPLWTNVLLIFFGPGLLSLLEKKRRWDRDPEERWQTIVTAFLGVVKRLDVGRRSERIASKIMNDTIHDAYRSYDARWSEQGLARTIEPDALARHEDPLPGIDLDGILLREAQQRRIALYQQALDARVIGLLDFYLLVATCVYGKAVADCAEERGVNYPMLKKRRQRALAAIAGWRRGR
jgi:hypothetical protein